MCNDMQLNVIKLSDVPVDSHQCRENERMTDIRMKSVATAMKETMIKC